MRSSTTGSILIFLGISSVAISVAIKIREDMLVLDLMKIQPGNTLFWYMLIWFAGGIITAAGVLIRRSEKDIMELTTSSLKMTPDLKAAKRAERRAPQFRKFLGSFDDDEQAVLEYIHTNEGVSETELIRHLGITSASLRPILAKLRKKDVIELMPDKKTRKIYLKKMSL